MKTRELIGLAAIAMLLSCSTSSSNEGAERGQAETKQESTAAKSTAAQSTVAGSRPRFSPDGQWVVFEREVEDGSHRIWRMRRNGDALEQIGPDDANSRHPTFDLEAKRVIFASDRDGDFDLYALDLSSGDIEQVTDLEGDETEPSVSPIRYTFYAAQTDSCTSSGASGTPLDAYQKVAFTRTRDDASEVWFASMTPTETNKHAFQTWGEPPVSEAHAGHVGRLSAKGDDCRSPRWSGDGLSMVWSCGGDEKSVVFDGPAGWEQSFAAAIKAVRGGEDAKTCGEEHLDDWRTDECFKSLPRRYTRFDASGVSSPDANVTQPSISANQTVLVGRQGGSVVWRLRIGDATWQDLPVDADEVAHPTWDPEGDRLAFDTAGEDGQMVGFTRTNFYMQDVQNLNAFPELVRTESTRLQKNGFVARPGDWKEFHNYYDKLRYMRRPAFVTADAALQAYRDEFQRVLQEAESKAAERLHRLSGALYRHYLKRYQKGGNKTDLYYARYFAAGWAPLEAYVRLEKPGEDLQRAAQWNDLDEDEQEQWDRLTAPAIERIPETLPDVVGAMPAPIRRAVSGWTDAMLAHEGVGKLDVPSYKEPFKVDFSQFKVRGTYAENDKGAYFLSMSWFSMAPLPFDSSLDEFRQAMANVSVAKQPAIEIWRAIDSTVGSFMGSPVDPAPTHLSALVVDDPDALTQFNGDAVADKLREMVGPTAIRDANSASPATTKRKIKVTFMPKRKGLDAEFFSKLTHPTVEGRPLASALDVFAVFGGGSALKNSFSKVEGEAYADDYRKTMGTLRPEYRLEGKDAYAPTDVYHSWMAVLVTLAKRHELPDESLMELTQTDAWMDRKLNSALAGFAQLKHSAVLYAAQDFAAECAGERPTYVLVEQPVLPQPRGFVDPEPQFFSQLAALAGNVYEQMADGKPPAGASFGYGTGALNAKVFAEKLAELSNKQVAGEELSREEYRWIRMVGGRLEAISMNRNPKIDSIQITGDARSKRGVALATDIQTNGFRDLALQIAIGRLMDMYVAVPNQPGRRMTQGGIFSFYEFTRPMSKRLTDAEWNGMLEAGEVPERPEWTDSFVQDVDVQWSEESADAAP